MKKVKKWILLSIFVCSVLALAYPVYAALDGNGELRSAPIPECPKDDEGNIILFPNPTDCRKYWQCINRVPMPMECPEGLYFCEEKSYCTWRFEPGCVFNCVMP